MLMTNYYFLKFEKENVKWTIVAAEYMQQAIETFRKIKGEKRTVITKSHFDALNFEETEGCEACYIVVRREDDYDLAEWHPGATRKVAGVPTNKEARMMLEAYLKKIEKRGKSYDYKTRKEKVSY